MDMGMNMGPMKMYFTWGPEVTLLFSSWTVSTWPAYLGSLLVCLLLAVCYEGLTVIRVLYSARLREKAAKEQEMLEASGAGALEANGGSHGHKGKLRKHPQWLAGGSIVDRLLASLMIGISAATSYLLMLMIMSFNVGVFIAVVLGHSFGVLLFGGVRILTESSLFADSHCGGW